MTAETARHLVARMETDVADVESWGDLLIALGALPEGVKPGVLLVIGYSLQQAGCDLKKAWAEAFSGLGGTP